MGIVQLGQRVVETQRVTLSGNELARAWGWTRGQMRGCLHRGELVDVGVGRPVRIDVDEAVARTLTLVEQGRLSPTAIEALCEMLARPPRRSIDEIYEAASADSSAR